MKSECRDLLPPQGVHDRFHCKEIMKWQSHLWLRCTLALFSGGAAHCVAAEKEYRDEILQGPVFTVIEENDFFASTDRHYTQGIRFSYLLTDNYFPFGMTNVYSRLPNIAFAPQAGKFGFAVGQNIYTPADTDDPIPDPNDRPYAGWLYLGMVFQRRGTSTSSWDVQEDIELNLGVVGPWALGKETQTWVHELHNEEPPQGWDYQLKNEPGVRLKFQRTHRWQAFNAGSFGGQFLPHFGMSLGNVETSFRVGGSVRFGFYLPDDYGLHTIDSLATSGSGRPIDGKLRNRWSGYVFASVEGRVVAYNVFLDGNLFRSSPHVDKEILVGDFKAGFAAAYGPVEVGYTQVYRTHEFKTQTEEDSFGAVFFKWRF